MAINLINEYQTLLDKRFTQKSLTDAWCGHDYSFDGVNSITVFTLGQATINDYDAGASSNRFGTPNELQDETNTYVLSKKRSFAVTLDITNVQDQKNIKQANAVIKQIWDEQMVPEIDKYRLRTWANGAGTAVLNPTALTKTTIIEQILRGQAHLNNCFVNRDGRVCFITESMAVQTKLATELQYNRNYTTTAIINGEVTRMGALPIVAVPDRWMPKGVEFMIKYKKASVDPNKLKLLRANTNAPGYAGTLIEGLTRYDSFVLANKSDGIYVYGNSNICTTPTASISSSKIVLAAGSGETIKYTTDGSNPKTSATANVYSAGLTVETGKILRAYAYKDGNTDSGILTVAEADVT